MSKITIGPVENGIAIPERTANRGRNRSELITIAMSIEVGQSFVVTTAHNFNFGLLKTALKHGRKFATEKVDKEKTRVWRIA